MIAPVVRRVWKYQRVIRIRKSKDRQHNGQKKKDKRRNNDLQNIRHKTKDRVTGTLLKIGCELRWIKEITNMSYFIFDQTIYSLILEIIIPH
jgi:hypothetical protein